MRVVAIVVAVWVAVNGLFVWRAVARGPRQPEGPAPLEPLFVIVTPQNVEIPMSLIPSEADLDGVLATLRDIDSLGTPERSTA